MSNAITVRLADKVTNAYAIEVVSASIVERDGLLAKAALVTAVTDLVTQQQAAEVVAELKGLAQATEKTRKALIDPFLKVQRDINQTAADFITNVDSQVKRIEFEIDRFVSYQRDLERERIRQAEAARIAAEEAARKAKQELEATEGRMEDTTEAEIALAEAVDEVVAVQAQVVVESAPVKVAGGSIREQVDFVVTDIDAFVRWDIARRDEAKKKYNKNLPSFFKATVNTRDLKSYLKMMGESEEIPGIAHTVNTRTAINAAKR